MTKELMSNLLEMKKGYANAYETLYESVVKYMEAYETDAQFKIMIDEFDFIRVRCTAEIDKTFLNGFCDDFNVVPAWDRKEIMKDFRNIDEASAVIFEYAFMRPEE